MFLLIRQCDGLFDCWINCMIPSQLLCNKAYMFSYRSVRCEAKDLILTSFSRAEKQASLLNGKERKKGGNERKV